MATAQRHKILYLVFSTGGHGGHFYSMMATARFATQFMDVHVASVGTKSFHGFDALPNYQHFNGVVASAIPVKILRYIKRKGIGIIHTFDAPSFYCARFVSCLADVRIVNTMCGGPKPTGFYPAATNQIVFSRENLEFIESQAVKPKLLARIPNRVDKVVTNTDAVAELRAQLRPGALTLMRISRFSNYYRKSIMGAIRMLDALLDEGINAELMLIGNVQDRPFYDELQALRHGRIQLIDEPRYTVKASGLLDAADMVIATGRGAMEAASIGKVLLTPVSSHDLPVLVTPQNADVFELYNFSERTEMDVTDPVAPILELARNREKCAALTTSMQQIAKERYLLGGVLETYKGLYNSLHPEQLTLREMALSYRDFIKPFFHQRLIRPIREAHLER